MFETRSDFTNALQGIITVNDQILQIQDEISLRTKLVDELVYAAVFSKNAEIQQASRWIIQEAGQKLDIIPASIHELYGVIGKGDIKGFTVPAINIRTLTYDVARAALRASSKLNVGAVIFEIARSEIGYTEQRPAEYTTAVIAAAIKEGFSGPLFLQGDHFQINRKIYAETPQNEINAIKSLIQEAIEANFYNIDIDASTIVDLKQKTPIEQQRPNYKSTAELLWFIRDIEPESITVSVGGEIGEIGGQNSTPEELRAFLTGLRQILDTKNKNLNGVSKVSVQTGTHHGGVVLPDGTLAQVKIDFESLAQLSKVAREEFNLGGIVQHGASTLPDNAFHKFAETETSEIHLATGFQNIIYDSQYFPENLRNRIYEFLKINFNHERLEDETEYQFLYKTRKRALGPFKEEIWKLPNEVRTQIRDELELKFLFLFDKLQVVNTKKLVAENITRIKVPLTPPRSLFTLFQ